MLRFCVAGIVALLLSSHAWADGCHLADYGTLPVEMIDGQPTTVVKINGTDTRFILDTGAFFNMMSRADAASLGLKLRPLPDDVRIGGIGGDTRAQYTTVKQFGILGTTIGNVDFIVGGSDTGYGLIGANLLDFADLEIDLAHGKLTLFKPDHCKKASMAYWVKDGNYEVADIESSDQGSDRQTALAVTINGKKLRAILDTGASMTLLSRDAAERIGIDLKGPQAKPGLSSMGIGSKALKAWTVNIDSFSVGTETIQHSQMVVLDGDIGGSHVDMLLGADFILAHHMFIANSQDKVYFTYNGGRVFSLAKAPADSDSASTSGKEAPLQNAADYALRGEAHLSRGEPNAAVADLDEAIRMAPDQPGYYLARARAHIAEKQLDAASADLDKSVSLDPKNIDALLLRANVRFSHKDISGATADVNAASVLAPAGSSQTRSIASFYIALDQPAAALPLLDAWIHVHNNDVQLGAALNERCWARSLSNQMLDDALSDCRKAIRRDGENPAYLDSLGMVQLRLGHYPESISAYEQALPNNKGSVWSHYGLGLAKIRSGQKDAGNADLAAARAINPDIDARAAKFGLTTAGP
ncbi:tetratricopeptide repeat protein [Dyella dinghuensis]|uniref:Tetratricopeptide repeat protein n=1 Tax=Dyella dinghuensis TaxID=1920169 RepID=A0A432LRK2_9GAMM|nr:aspartyl protease family protein [Dyella dinghuensis]RUL63175.1 tetratricopeptide repeat protein [Dyella dinghuensis]